MFRRCFVPGGPGRLTMSPPSANHVSGAPPPVLPLAVAVIQYSSHTGGILVELTLSAAAHCFVRVAGPWPRNGMATPGSLRGGGHGSSNCGSSSSSGGGSVVGGGGAPATSPDAGDGGIGGGGVGAGEQGGVGVGAGEQGGAAAVPERRAAAQGDKLTRTPTANLTRTAAGAAARLVAEFQATLIVPGGSGSDHHGVGDGLACDSAPWPELAKVASFLARVQGPYAVLAQNASSMLVEFSETATAGRAVQAQVERSLSARDAAVSQALAAYVASAPGEDKTRSELVFQIGVLVSRLVAIGVVPSAGALVSLLVASSQTAETAVPLVLVRTEGGGVELVTAVETAGGARRSGTEGHASAGGCGHDDAGRAAPDTNSQDRRSAAPLPSPRTREREVVERQDGHLESVGLLSNKRESTVDGVLAAAEVDPGALVPPAARGEAFAAGHAAHGPPSNFPVVPLPPPTASVAGSGAASNFAKTTTSHGADVVEASASASAAGRQTLAAERAPLSGGGSEAEGGSESDRRQRLSGESAAPAGWPRRLTPPTSEPVLGESGSASAGDRSGAAPTADGGGANSTAAAATPEPTPGGPPAPRSPVRGSLPQPADVVRLHPANTPSSPSSASEMASGARWFTEFDHGLLSALEIYEPAPPPGEATSVYFVRPRITLEQATKIKHVLGGQPRFMDVLRRNVARGSSAVEAALDAFAAALPSAQPPQHMYVGRVPKNAQTARKPCVVCGIDVQQSKCPVPHPDQHVNARVYPIVKPAALPTHEDDLDLAWKKACTVHLVCAALSHQLHGEEFPCTAMGVCQQGKQWCTFLRMQEGRLTVNSEGRTTTIGGRREGESEGVGADAADHAANQSQDSTRSRESMFRFSASQEEEVAGRGAGAAHKRRAAAAAATSTNPAKFSSAAKRFKE